MATSINSLAFRLSKSFMYVPGLPLRKCFGLSSEKVCVYTVWDWAHNQIRRTVPVFWSQAGNCLSTPKDDILLLACLRFSRSSENPRTVHGTLRFRPFPQSAQVTLMDADGPWHYVVLIVFGLASCLDCEDERWESLILLRSICCCGKALPEPSWWDGGNAVISMS